MSYRLNIYNTNESYYDSWFINSWNALEDVRGKLTGLNSSHIYAKIYNVKVDGDIPFDMVESVEFESEDDAIMFMLKWS